MAAAARIIVDLRVTRNKSYLKLVLFGSARAGLQSRNKTAAENRFLLYIDVPNTILTKANGEQIHTIEKKH
jgi:hypothetical protein